MIEFDFSSRTVEEWCTLQAKASRTTYMQSLPFGRAVRVHDQRATKLALIVENKTPVGMMAVQEIKIGPVHVISLYRGPLWFSHAPTDKLIRAFIKSSLKPTRKGF